MGDANERLAPGLSPVGADEPDDDAAEAPVRRATWVLAWLGLATVASGVGIAVVLRPEPDMSAQRLTLVSLMAGALGSGLVALVAVADHVADTGADEGFGTGAAGATGGGGVARWLVPLYAIRPLLGAGAGLLAYTGLVGVLLFASRTGSEQPRTESVLFLAILAGLFAKALVDRLKDGLDRLSSRR